MNTKNNQRYRDNEVRMEAAMLGFLKGTGFDKITVRRICEKAGVNRSTFYAHFKDTYDMMALSAQEIESSASVAIPFETPADALVKHPS